MWNAEGERKIHTGLRWGYLKEREHSENTGVEGKITLKWILNSVGGCAVD